VPHQPKTKILIMTITEQQLEVTIQLEEITVGNMQWNTVEDMQIFRSMSLFCCS
jgi:hypothetical protein